MLLCWPHGEMACRWIEIVIVHRRLFFRTFTKVTCEASFISFSRSGQNDTIEKRNHNFFTIP